MNFIAPFGTANSPASVPSSVIVPVNCNDVEVAGVGEVAAPDGGAPASSPVIGMSLPIIISVPLSDAPSYSSTSATGIT